MQAAASAPLCNLALYFSPVQEQIVAAGGLAQLAALTQRNNEPSLRLNAVWALKNLTAMPSATAKAAIMTQLPYESLRSLLDDTAEPSVQVRDVALRRGGRKPFSGVSALFSEEQQHLLNFTGS